MPEICSICGEWKLMNIIHWDFNVDEERRCSISVIPEDIFYKELIGVVLEGFALDITIKVQISFTIKIYLCYKKKFFQISLGMIAK